MRLTPDAKEPEIFCRRIHQRALRDRPVRAATDTRLVPVGISASVENDLVPGGKQHVAREKYVVTPRGNLPCNPHPVTGAEVIARYPAPRQRVDGPERLDLPTFFRAGVRRDIDLEGGMRVRPIDAGDLALDLLHLLRELGPGVMRRRDRELKKRKS